MKRTAKFARFVIAIFALALGVTAYAADEEKTGGGMISPTVTQRP